MSPIALADDLLAEEVNADPYPYFAALREHDPVHYSERHRAWLVTRYDDVAAGMRDLRLSSDRVRPLLEAMTPEKRATAGPVMELITGWMVVTDPPVHTRPRPLAAHALHPPPAAKMEGQIPAVLDPIPACAGWPPTPSSPSAWRRWRTRSGPSWTRSSTTSSPPGRPTSSRASPIRCPPR